MGKNTRFSMDLANGEGPYYPGQPVTGKVYLDLRDDRKITSIKVKLRGHGFVTWVEDNHNGTRRRTEEYMNSTIDLLNKNSEITLAKGFYTYTYFFNIPNVAPASYTSPHGNYGVSWTVKASIVKPGCLFDKHIKKEIHVDSYLDLNTYPRDLSRGASLNRYVKGTSIIGQMFFGKKEIEATFRINKLGFVPGETIQFNAVINNNGTPKVHYIKAVLVIETSYFAKKIEIERKWINEIKHEVQILGGSTFTLNNGTMYIPKYDFIRPSTVFDGCRLISISYKIELKIVSKGIGSDIIIPVSVVIGSVPLFKNAHQVNMALPYWTPSPYTAMLPNPELPQGPQTTELSLLDTRQLTSAKM